MYSLAILEEGSPESVSLGQSLGVDGTTLPRGSKGESIPSLLRVLVAAASSWLLGTSISRPSSYHLLFRESNLPLPPSYKDICDSI